MGRLVLFGIRVIGGAALLILDVWDWWKLPGAVRAEIRALRAIGAEVEPVSRVPGETVHLVRLEGREMLLVGASLYCAGRQGRWSMGANLEINTASIRIVDGQPLFWARDEYGWHPTHGDKTRTFRFLQIAVRGTDEDGNIIVWAKDVVGWHLCLGMQRVDGPFPEAPYGQRVEGGKVIPLFAEDDVVVTSAADTATN
ncbi:hypothetical protein EPO33_01965 [Patescibacteria group bacterium]|nr:MAG: hypothetical protein EPO33_01965 [Patescibacteria group bacterium]